MFMFLILIPLRPSIIKDVFIGGWWKNLIQAIVFYRGIEPELPNDSSTSGKKNNKSKKE